MRSWELEMGHSLQEGRLYYEPVEGALTLVALYSPQPLVTTVLLLSLCRPPEVKWFFQGSGPLSMTSAGAFWKKQIRRLAKVGAAQTMVFLHSEPASLFESVFEFQQVGVRELKVFIDGRELSSAHWHFPSNLQELHESPR